MKDIYISYSKANTDWANFICSLLEKEGAHCFLAERDLDRTNANWPMQLMRALIDCSKVILLLTATSNSSQEVLNEIANASARGMEIIPVLQDNIAIGDELMYFIRKYEWIQLYDYSDEEGKRILLQRVLGRNAQPVLSNSTIRLDNLLLFPEDECFEKIHTGGYGVGLNKCLIQNGVNGWNPSDIIIEEVIDEVFSFADIGRPELDEAYQEYCLTPEIQKMERRGNNRARWMIADIYQNNKIYITLRRTSYSMTSFWWNQVRDNPAMRKSMAEQVFEHQGSFFPNSFCLHLIVETKDDYLLCTRISNNKKNDYAQTVAITLGEQLSGKDFEGNTSYNNQFVRKWIKRAFIEEFGFHNEDFEKYVDTTSFRVLALTYEGDIYNFALPTFVRLKLNYDELLKYLNSTKVSIDEFTKIEPKESIKAIEIAKAWEDEDERRSYHPSSFLRALLYAQYRGQIETGRKNE